MWFAGSYVVGEHLFAWQDPESDTKISVCVKEDGYNIGAAYSMRRSEDIFLSTDLLALPAPQVLAIVCHEYKHVKDRHAEKGAGSLVGRPVEPEIEADVYAARVVGKRVMIDVLEMLIKTCVVGHLCVEHCNELALRIRAVEAAAI